MMTFKDIALFLSDKKRQEQISTDCKEYGYKINKAVTIGENHTILNLVVRAILVYLCIVGSIDAYMSAFNLPYNTVKILISLGLTSFLMIILQYNVVTRLLGYTGVVILLSRYMEENIMIIRSGIVAIINMSYELIRIKFSLPQVDGFTETITNRQLTVTTAIITIGSFLIIVFWEVAARSMNLVLTAFITFTALSLGLYFDGVPSGLSIIAFGTIWLFIAVVKFNSKHEVSFKRQSYTHIFVKNNRYYHKYSDGKTLLQLLILSFLFVGVATSVVKPVYTRQVFEKTVMPSELKDNSDKLLKNMMIIGFSKYKGYKITGRISEGQLGNYGSIRPDYEPDLEVEFLPVNNDNIYFKSFIGSSYYDNGWHQFENQPYTNKTAMYMTVNGLKKNDYPASKMRVKNLGVITDRPLLPYYADYDSVNLPIEYIADDMLKGRFNVGEVSELEYYPYTDLQTKTGISCDDVSNGYRDFVYKNYLYVPDKNKKLISQLCIQQGWHKNDENIDRKIADFFQNEFTYTLNPGLVPWKTDFINYFLFENREGVCAHFASAGTLIYRSLGIPARYVEGYVMPFQSVYEGELVENADLSYYYKGNLQGLTYVPTKVTLSDFNAHAWVEIYVNGFGWTPVELTPMANLSSQQEEEEKQEQWSEIIARFMQSLQSDNKTNEIISQESVDKITEELPSVGYALGSGILLLYIIVISYKHIVRNAIIAFSKPEKALLYTYSHLVNILVYLGLVSENPDFNQIYRYFDNWDKVLLIQKVFYSDEKMDADQIKLLIKAVNKMKRNVISKQKIIKRILLYIKV